MQKVEYMSIFIHVILYASYYTQNINSWINHSKRNNTFYWTAFWRSSRELKTLTDSENTRKISRIDTNYLFKRLLLISDSFISAFQKNSERKNNISENVGNLLLISKEEIKEINDGSYSKDGDK